MRAFGERVSAVLGRAWWWLRQVSGDAAYENYLRWASQAAAPRVLPRREFFLELLARKYARVSRCC